MIIKPNCSFCNNNTCICHQRNLIYSLQCNICLKTCNNNIKNDIKQGEYIGETSRHLIKRLNEHINAIKIILIVLLWLHITPIFIRALKLKIERFP